MLYQNLKFAFRYIINNKIYSILNLTGLAIGLAISLIVYLILFQEISYDRFHRNFKEIYQVMSYEKKETGSSLTREISLQTANALSGKIPEFEVTTRIPSQPAQSLMINDHSLNEAGIYGDPNLFKVFSFDLINGNPENVLESINNIVISESLASKYFPGKNPIGQTIGTQGSSGQVFNVSGIMKDIPVNSTLQFDYIIPGRNIENQAGGSLGVYVKLRPGTIPSDINRKIESIAAESDFKDNVELFIFPFSRLHVFPVRYKDATGGGMMGAVAGLSIIGCLILFVACVNYTNLATALFLKRSRDTGVKKIVGSSRRRLSIQFLFESLILSFISIVIGLLTANLIVPWFNRSFNWDLRVDYSDPKMILGLITLLFITTILSGLYPALYLSSLNPLQILKGADAKGTKNAGLRRILVTIQFFFAVFLIILSISFIKQIQYVKKKDLGVNIEDMIIFSLNENLLKNIRPVKAEIANVPAVENVSFVSQNPLLIWAETTDINYDGKEPGEPQPFSLIEVDFDFVKTMDLKVSAGRDFDKSIATDSSNFILNEKAAKIIGSDNVIGRKFRFKEKEGTIIGVIKDYHMTHMNFPMKPLIICINKNSFSTALIRFRPGTTERGTEEIRRIIAKTDNDPERFFISMREAFENIYRENIFRMGKLTVMFSLLALCIACLGLISLSMYNAELRTKEIGIHKVHGADTFRIIIMLIKEYLIWVSVSLVFAIPAGYLVINKLFSRTAYHTKLSFWIFFLAGIIVLTIAVCTVGWQAYRLSRQNPAKTLKNE